jgi:hypothetical protein
MFPLMTAISTGMNLLGSVKKLKLGQSQNKMADEINPEWNKYNKNPLAAQNLGAAQNLFYGKNRAFTQAEANIRQAQSDQMSNAQRNATDSSTLLGTGAAAAGQTKSALSNLAGQESGQQAGLLDNLSRAFAMSINEGDKENISAQQKYFEDKANKAALRQGGYQNMGSAWSELGATIGGLQGFFKDKDGDDSGQKDQYAALRGMNSNIANQQQRVGASPGLATQDFTNGNTGNRRPMPANISPNYRGIPMGSFGQNWNPITPWGQ